MYSAALDLSGNEAVFALQRTADGVVICAASRPMRGRTASAMAPWIIELLHEHGAGLNEITHWTVGSGPGSFTGMRLAAAFVAGLTAENPDVKTRCVPTAIALAYGENYREGEKIGTIFDGRNHEILVYGLIFAEGELKPCGEPAVLDAAQAEGYFKANCSDRYIAYEYELEAIDKIIKLPVISRTGLNAAGLLNAKYAPWNNDLTELVYIRPAVHSTSN